MTSLLYLSLILPASAQQPDPDPAPAAPTAPAPVVDVAALVAAIPSETAAPTGDYGPTLGLAAGLSQDGDPDSARALAEWVALRPDAGPAADQARALQLGIKDGSGKVGPTIRLVAAQAAAGAWLLGPNQAYAELYGDHEATYFAGALVGGAAGVAGGLLLARQPDFGPAHVSAIVGPQVLLGFNGAVIGSRLRPDAWGAAPAGILVGGLAGTGLGVAWNLAGPDPAVTLGLESGAAWGLGLTVAGLSWSYAWDRVDYDDVPVVLVVATDIGAAVGVAATALLPIDRGQLTYLNAGGALGAGLAYAFARTTSGVVWYAPHDVAALVGGAGVVGGALGFVLATRLDRVPALPVGQALLRVEDGRPAFALPMPRVALVDGQPGVDGRLGLQVALVDQAF